MNAPAPIAATSPALRMIPLADIEPSRTHIQELRRKRFDPKALQELADSIKAVGLLQPVVVVDRDGADFELVAGERRWQAAKLAGLAAIPATVRELTPEQILEVQLIENLQREGLHELEEAEGYDELMKLKKINADAVAEMVGKSRSYVYARTKLLALCPEARKAFYAGELDASKALLVARIGHHDTQRQALKEISDRDMSFRDTQDFVQRNYMLRLKEAPFDIKAEDLVAKAGACGACPKRTGNQRDLFPDVKDADVCTDPKCFAAKKAAGIGARVAEAKATGRTVITGAEAKKIYPYQYGGVGGGYVSLTTTCWDDPRHRNVGQILGKNHPAVALILNPHTEKFEEIVPSSALTEALNEQGIKTSAQKAAAGRAKQQAKAEKAKDEGVDDEALRAEVMKRIVAAVRAKVKKPLSLDAMRALVNRWATIDDSHQDIDKAFSVTPSHHSLGKGFDKLGAEALAQYLTAQLLANEFEGYGHGGDLARVIAASKIDVAAIGKQAVADLKAKAATPKAAEKKAPPKKVAKGKGKKK